MWITVWRHGEAAPGAVDEHRALTDRGRRSTLAAAQRYRVWLDASGVPRPTQLLFSPLVRTTQTAELVGMALGLNSQSCAELVPGADPGVPQAYLAGADDNAHVVMVSHQPFVSELIDVWLDPIVSEPLMPGGWACLKLTASARGAGELCFIEPTVY